MDEMLAEREILRRALGELAQEMEFVIRRDLKLHSPARLRDGRR